MHADAEPANLVIYWFIHCSMETYLWSVIELRFIVLDRRVCSVVCILGQPLGVHSRKGLKMLVLRFICLSGPNVPPLRNTKQTLSRLQPLTTSLWFLLFFLLHYRTPAAVWGLLPDPLAATPAIIEPKQNEVMTESCPQPLWLDLQLKCSRLKGRVH